MNELQKMLFVLKVLKSCETLDQIQTTKDWSKKVLKEHSLDLIIKIIEKTKKAMLLVACINKDMYANCSLSWEL